jgi:hypothetical protein
MANDENKNQSAETSGDQKPGGVADLDRNEGQTLNGVVGGTGSDLEQDTSRLGGNENKPATDQQNSNK